MSTPLFIANPLKSVRYRLTAADKANAPKHDKEYAATSFKAPKEEWYW